MASRTLAHDRIRVVNTLELEAFVRRETVRDTMDREVISVLLTDARDMVATAADLRTW